MPISTNNPDQVVGSDIADAVKQAFQHYVDLSGTPIESCTLLLRPRHQQRWDIPDRLRSQARRSTEMLALSCMAEQRFLEGHFSPHLNASMFQLVEHRIRAGSNRISLHFPRRGNDLRLYTTTDNVKFQQPRQVQGTRCEIIGTRLARALTDAYRTESPAWGPISSSLQFFFLGHSETQELSLDSCLMLSAMAFEQLLEPKPLQKERVSQAMGRTLATLWAPYEVRMLSQSKRIKPDPKYAADQQTWPLRWKWMKELYELRNATAHRGPKSDLSRNWEDWQHIIIAGFVYPFAVKLKLAEMGLYQFSAREVGACETLDRLLESNWKKGKEKQPEWPRMLSLSEAAAVLGKTPHQNRSKAASKHHPQTLKTPKRASYD